MAALLVLLDRGAGPPREWIPGRFEHTPLENTAQPILRFRATFRRPQQMPRASAIGAAPRPPGADSDEVRERRHLARDGVENRRRPR
jgi:hypothetical protein